MRKRFAIGLTGIALGLVLLGAIPGPAVAAFGINGFDVTFENEDGTPATVAGTHPFAMTTEFHLNTVEFNSDVIPDEELKDLYVDLPPGFAGNPTAVPTCPTAVFLRINPVTERSACPDDTAVGYLEPEIVNPGYNKPVAVFNLAPPPGMAAQLGALVEREAVTIDVGVRRGSPYNVTSGVLNTPQAVLLFGSKVVLWGNPASPVHDSMRGACATIGGDCPSDAPEKPFLTLPRSCGGPLFATYGATSWQSPAASHVTGSSATALDPSDCEAIEFGPTIDAQPTSASAESPSGLNFRLDVDDPGLSEVGGRAASDIEKAVVTLPAGVTTNPAVASGLSACTLAQYESETVTSEPGTGCPESSKIGSVEVETPLLEDKVLRGTIYVAKQGDNPFGNLLTVLMVIKDPGLGILVRVAGRVDPDPVTGQLTTTFDDLPQLPFSHFRLHFREGRRAPLITPATCGTFTTDAYLYPYARPSEPAHESASFEIVGGANDGACASSAAQLPHTPNFVAGTRSSRAGAFSPFVLKLERPDGSQQIGSVATTLPVGLLGKLAGIPYCSEAGIAQALSRSGEGLGAAELTSPSCPDAARVGGVEVAAGAGPDPYRVTGNVYLAGPYKGAPLSLEIVTPAIAGPFDLGVVAVRTALHVDPLTAQIRAVSDPIPSILHGLPLDVRSIVLTMDRPEFTLNPTSCEPKAILGTATSILEQPAALSQYFQASSCGGLKFAPKLKLTLKGATKRSGHPALKAVLTFPKGSSANIARAQVGLPHSEFLDQGNIGEVCTQPQLKSKSCPKGSIYGRAKAWSPLLDRPLEGPVYLGVGFGHRLPDLVADLDGQIRVLLNGRVDTTKQDGLRNTFEAVPDAPVSKFMLELKGGKKKGLIENSENLCRRSQRASAKFIAQNGKVLQAPIVIGNDCGKQKGKAAKRNTHRAR